MNSVLAVSRKFGSGCYCYRLSKPKIAGRELLAILTGLLAPLSADQSGNFTYTDTGSTITITHYPFNATGNLVIPASIGGKPVTNIGDYAFNNCRGLTGVEIPASVTHIGVSSFSSCDGFMTLTIPASVSSIGSGAFGSCAGLTSVTITQGVTSIGNGAFNSCTSLTEVLIPASVTIIGRNPFGSCRKLASIAVSDENPAFSSEGGALFDKEKTKLIGFPQAKGATYSIPPSVIHIGDDAFANFAGLIEVTLPPDLVTIGDGAFRSCTALPNITIPQSVKSIGASAFSSCAKLAGIDVPTGVASIGGSAFAYCGSLTSATLPPGLIEINGSLFSYCAKLADLVIPSSVQVIGKDAFNGCNGITDIVLPSSVLSLGESAFSNCSNLAGATLQNGLISIGKTAFSGCKALSGITIPSSVSSIGANVFIGCSALTAITVDPGNPGYSDAEGVLFDKLKTVLIRYPALLVRHYTIPSSVITIEPYAFSPNKSLASVSIPQGTTTIGNHAFDYCTSLEKVDFPQGLVSIGDEAFADCTSLKSLSIPSSVTSIGSYAFGMCGMLESASIQSSAPNIGWLAFRDCMKLQRIVFSGNAAIVDENLAKTLLPELKIYYYNGSTGFTPPTWMGYPTVNMGDETPLKNWLVERNLPYDSDLQSDVDQDGVNLLMAYALGLDPERNPVSGMPRPVITQGTLSLVFYAGTAGITYDVEASEDMIHWSRRGITISDPDANQFRTATITRKSPSCLMRIVVSDR